MWCQILKVLGPFPVVDVKGKPAGEIFSVIFVYGDKTEEGEWRRQGQVDVTAPITKDKAEKAIKAWIQAIKPHPLDGQECEI